MMTDEQSNVKKSEHGEEEPTIKSAEVHIGTTVEIAQTEGASGVEAMELPLRILVLGDFTPNAPTPSDWAEASPPIRVDASNFQAVMEQLNPGLALSVHNHLNGGPKPLKIDLRFPNIEAFSPEGIVEQVEPLSALLAVRKLVVQLQNSEIDLSKFERQLGVIGADPAWVERIRQRLKESEAVRAEKQPEQPPPATPLVPKSEPQTGEDQLDSLLSMVDVGGTQTPSPREQEAKSAVDDLVRAIVKPKGSGVEQSIPDAIIDDIDTVLGAQVNAILHNRAFQQLESTWRGLKFLINRTNFRENVQLELLSVPKAHLRDATYQQVFQPEYNDLSEFPLSVIIADYEFDSTPGDIELLGDIARMATSMQAPFISSVGHAFFGMETAEEQAKVPLFRSLFNEPQYAKWRALREDETSQSLTLTTSRFLLRYPYRPNGEPVKTFNFTERTASSADYLWGRGAFALATTLIRSFIERGWCTQITGQRGGGIVSNLPLWSYRAMGRQVQIPIDVLYSQSKESEFGPAGLALLSCRINSDAAYVLSAPTIHRPAQYTDPAETKEAQMHATLAYQLFATRMAHCLRQIMKNISTGLTAEQVSAMFTGQLRSVLAKASDTPLLEEAVIIEVTDNEERPEVYDVALRIRPPFRILGGSVDLLLGFELPK